MAQDGMDIVSATQPSTNSASNLKTRTQNLGHIVQALADSNSSVLSKLAAIASAVTASLIGGSTGTTANQVLVAKGTTGRALQATPVTIDPANGNVDTNGGDLTVEDITAATGNFTTSLQRNGNNVAIATQTVGCSFTFKYPEAEEVFLILNAQFAWTITQTVTITEAGTATVTVSNNGSSLSANSASTSQDIESQNSAVALNTYVSVIFSSVSATCENLCLTIWGTRTLAT